MRYHIHAAVFYGGLVLATGSALAAGPIAIARQEPAMTRADGSFEVKLIPLELPEDVKNPTIASRGLDKRYHGDLDATSLGVMLSTGSAQDSGGYVAIERVSGTLHGRQGSFALQHNATMARGVPSLHIVVVPDSGTDELTGLSGQMTITIAKDGAHSYTFDYTFE